MERITMREYVPSTGWEQTEWISKHELLKWLKLMGFQYAAKRAGNKQYIFVLKDRSIGENDPPEQVIVYLIDYDGP